MEKAKKLSDVLKEKGIATELTSMESVVGKEIIIHGFEEQPGSFETSFAIYATLEGEAIKILTTATVIRHTLAHAQGSFPVKATVRQVKGTKYPYYVLE